MAARAYIGTSGFTYDHWRDVFYPPDVPQRRWLEFYAEQFDTVELNNTFYALPRIATCDNWRTRTPPHFLFAVKLNRMITHRLRLLRPEEWLGRYMEAVEHLGDKLGPILVQLPPAMRADPGRLEEFLAVTPRSRRWCVEFRNADWLRDDVYDVLHKYNAALVIHDLIPDHPREVTADFVYYRYHGSGARYASNYSSQELRAAADQIARQLRAKLDVYAYFNNDIHGYAVLNALELKKMLGQGSARKSA